MNTERIQPHFSDDREAVVTYSRLPSRRPSGMPPAERMEPRLDAAEIPLIDPGEVPRVDPHDVDPHDDVDPGFAEVRPELRADPIYADTAAADAGHAAGRRPRSMSVVILGATFAMLAGFGVLAGSIGVATVIPGDTPAETAGTVDSPLVSEPPLRLTSGEALPDTAAEPSGVREIPLAVGEEAPAAEASAKVAPPLPRPRPEGQTASLEPWQPPESETPEPRSDAASAPVPPPPAETAGPLPAEGVVIEAPSGAAVSAGPAPLQPRGTDPLISDIEQTLARIDKAPAGAATANVATAPPPILQAPAGEPATVVPPGYPMEEECAPSGSVFGPCYDVMPPEAMTGNGYYVPEPVPPAYMGPVPPEPVPYANPPATAEGGLFSDEAAEAEERPGFVRRAITRTADAVSRVFGRDRDRDRDRDNDINSDINVNINND